MEQLVSAAANGAQGRCCLAVPSRDYFYTAGTEGVVRRYTLCGASWELSNTLDEADQYHDDPINEICFSPSGDYFAVCSDDGTVSLLRHPTNSVQSVLCKFDCGASSISFDASSQYSFLLAMSSDSGTVKLVNALNYASKYYEFECHGDGVRSLSFVPFQPDPYKTSREKYLAVAQSNGALSLWKVVPSNVFDAEKECEDKVVRAQHFEGVFPEIKGADSNQRLLFDSAPNGVLLAIPGNREIKILDTRSMAFAEAKDLAHGATANCCAFSRFAGESPDGPYVLATGDVAGNVVIWSLRFEGDALRCSASKRITARSGICQLLWMAESELLFCSMDGAVHRVRADAAQRAEPNEPMDTDPAAESAPAESTKKGRFEDSDEDFDIDMDHDTECEHKEAASPSPTKIVLRAEPKKAEPAPTAQPEAVAAAESAAAEHAAESNEGGALRDDLAAAEAMFGDDDDDDFGGGALSGSAAAECPNKEKAARSPSAERKEAEAVEAESARFRDAEDAEMGDLDPFVVADGGDAADCDGDGDGDGDGERGGDAAGGGPLGGAGDAAECRPPRMAEQGPFVNGGTEFGDDGQRYLMMNEICGVVVRKQDVSSNPMESIMSALNNRRYSVEVDFFDKARYSRAVSLRSDHHFACCAVNAFGLLLGSAPSLEPGGGAEAKESIVRYRPIARNGRYRSFASDKDCEWSTRLPLGEQCVAVALTAKFAVIATSRRFLRILSVGGLQSRSVVALPRGVIHIAQSSEGNVVAITFEDLSLWILDLDANRKLHEGHAAISPDARLVRVFLIGTASDFKLLTVDSEGVVRLLSDSAFGGGWIVVLDLGEHLSSALPADPDSVVMAEQRPKGIWPVFFDRDERKLMAIDLQFAAQPTPSSEPIVLREYPLSLPLLNMGPDAVDENTGDVIVPFGNREAAAMTASVGDELAPSAQSEGQRKQNAKRLLKEYLMLFGHCCSENRAVVAYDVALHFLSTEKALSSAIKVAVHHQMPLLAEQISNLAKERMESRAAPKTRQLPQSKSAPKTKQPAGGSPSPSANSANTANTANTNSIKRPSRTLGRLKRPTAKLGANRKSSCEAAAPMDDVTGSLQRTQLIGNKRPNNPCAASSAVEPPKKRNYAGNANPFSCHDAQRQSKKSSLFSV